MVARPPRPLSAFTRNMAFGRASWTTPSNSSLSPLGSLGPVLLFCLRLMLGSRSEGRQHPRRDLFRLTDAVDPAQEPLLLVVREQGRGHRFLGIEALSHGFGLIVGPMLQISARGRRSVDKMIALSSPFVGPPVDKPFFETMSGDVELEDGVDLP